MKTRLIQPRATPKAPLRLAPPPPRPFLSLEHLEQSQSPSRGLHQMTSPIWSASSLSRLEENVPSVPETGRQEGLSPCTHHRSGTQCPETPNHQLPVTGALSRGPGIPSGVFSLRGPCHPHMGWEWCSQLAQGRRVAGPQRTSEIPALCLYHMRWQLVLVRCRTHRCHST